MSFKDEFEKILLNFEQIATEAKLDDNLTDIQMVKILINNRDKALTSIINLVDKEVIGEDEQFIKPTTTRRTYAEISRYSRQALKNEQRAKLKGDK